MSKATKVPALLLEGDDKMERARSLPGAFFYYSSESHGDRAGIIHSCPCGCQKLGHLNLDPQSDRPCWKLQGPINRPTLSPSIGIRPWQDEVDVEGDGFHWHGHLVEGVWISV